MIKVLSIFALLLGTNAWAYYDVLDTGEVMTPGKFKITGGVQAMTSTGGGNLDGIFDMGFREEFGLRAVVGVGKTDYSAGALFKWMPIPDVDNQPAIGFNVGLLYAKWMDARDMTVRFEPLVSKKFVMDICTLTPYASLPLGIRMRNSDNADINTDTRIPIQFVAGTQLELTQFKNLQFMGEVGVDIDNSVSHITLGAIYYFDENGFEWK